MNKIILADSPELRFETRHIVKLSVREEWKNIPCPPASRDQFLMQEYS